MTPSAETNIVAAVARDWDAIVIGAGPAGAVAARQTALAGARTLLVERRAFPRNKVCGACLNRSALASLETLELIKDVTCLGGVPIRLLHLQSGRRELSLPLPGGLAVSRARLDMALVSAAMTAGVSFLPETAATVGGLVREGVDEWRNVALGSPAGARPSARARVVLVADGLGQSSLDAHPEFSSQVRPNSRVGLGGLVEVFPEFYRTGTIYMGIGHGGYVGLVRVEDERLNVAAAVDAALVREQHSPAKALHALLREAGFPPIAALDQTAWQGTLPLTRCSPRLADRRLLLLGDAAGYVEPFTGEGIAWALAAASQIAPFAIRGLADWTEQLENEWTLEMRRRVTRRQRWCRRLALALRFPRVCRGLLATISLAPRLAQPVIRALNAPPLSAEGLI